LDGWACRYRVLENGKRQIISLFLPGDICEPFGALPRVTGYPIGALTPLRVAWLPLEDLSRAARDYPSLNKALWWDLLLTETLVHEGMVSLGRRSAMERMAYLFCELHFRLSLVDLVRDDVFDMPVTQADIADLLGLSSVHVNRSLQELRGSGIISLRWQHLEIHRVSALCDLALWDPIYLDFGDVVPMAAPGAATG
jgi:CRP-like cAMP-binding protein